MKKYTFSLIGVFLITSFIGNAQINPGWCATDQYLQKRIDAAPELVQQIQESMTSAASSHALGEKVLKTVPVVFHILHSNGTGNISDAQVQSALDVLNRDFNRLNADAVNTRSTATAPFQAQAASMEMEFKLAKIDPNGNCTNGILRKNVASNITFDVNMDTEPHKYTGSGGSSAWPRNEYFNIWIVNTIAGSDVGIILGYAQFPDNWGGAAATYGLTMRQDYTGTIETAAGNDGRTVTHEVGHCFGLFHIFQEGCHTNSCNSNGDFCCDTPPQSEASYNCSSSLNSCTSIPTNDSYGFDALDQIENYMSYNACQNMFTYDQATIMESKISTLSYLTNLTSSGNATLTGINLPDVLCKAEFSADRTTICAGESVVFSDESYNAATGWSWSFPSGSPASSTDQNPVVSYGTPGLYTVTLTSNDGTNSDGETKTAYINVLPVASSIPFVEGFESYSTLDNLNNWEIVNSNNNNKFTLETTLGHTGSKSAKLVNFGQAGGSSDELIASAVDLSGVSSVTLSFRYAYRKKTTTDLEYLKVFITNNCGEVWTQRKTISGNALSSLTSTTSWAPTSISDWTTVHMTNVTSDYWVENFRYKFKFESDGGNNLYLDNINIYEGSPSDGIVVGLTEGTDITDLALFPNPTDAEVNVRFTVAASQQVLVQLQDVSGKIVKTTVVNAIEGSNLVILDTADMAAGAYFMKLNVGGSEKTLQFVVK